MAVIGAVTVVFGALLAFVQKDIKKVLAYSTISQLGYMVMALGVGAWTAAIFHLFTHAIFKACLFLGAGSLSHHIHTFDMKKDMGGLRKRMPITFWTFIIGTGVLMGIFPLAGFWSKDEILVGRQRPRRTGWLQGHARHGPRRCLPAPAAYMIRVIWYTFFGEPRGLSAEHEIHENGPRITVPLIILSALAVLAGLVNLPHSGILFGVPTSISLQFEQYVEPSGAVLPEPLDTAFRHPEFNVTIALVSTAIALIAILLAYPSTGGAWARTGSRSAAGWPASATRCSRTSTTSTGSTPTSSRPA